MYLFVYFINVLFVAVKLILNNLLQLVPNYRDPMQ